MVMATQTVPLGLRVEPVVLWALTTQTIKEVQLRVQGVQLSYIPIRDVRAFADAYLQRID